MAASESSKTKIQQMYVAYYGRPGDPAGVEYWGSVLDVAEATGGTIDSIISAFGDSAEYTSGIGAGTTTEQVTALYQQMFNRDPEADGLAFWVASIDGTRVDANGDPIPAISLGTAALAVAESAQNDDATTLANKVTAADYYTAQVTATGATYTSSDITAAKAIISGVTSDPVTVVNSYTSTDSQLASQGGTVSTGQSYTLTTSVDSLTGTSGDDTFIATSSATTPTLNLGDNMNGGDGTDTLKITSNIAGAIPAPVTTSVETYEITSAAADTLAVNSLSAGLTAVNFVGGSNTTFTLSGIATTTDVSFDSEDQDVTVTYNSVTGTADSANLAIGDLSSTNFQVSAAGLETVNLTLNGDSSTKSVATGLTIDNATTLNATASNVAAMNLTEVDLGAVDVLTTLNVTGSGAGGVDFGTLPTSVVTVDASAASAGVTFALASTAQATVTGGSGNDSVEALTADDKITLGAGDDKANLAAVVMSGGSLVGGDGTDTLVISEDTSTLFTTASKALISGFETFQIGGTSKTYDMEALTGIASLVVGTTTTAATVNNLSTTAAASVNVIGDGAALTLNVKGATTPGTTDTLMLNLDHATANTAITIADLASDGVENITINSSGAGTNTNSVDIDSTNSTIQKVTITGDSKFDLTSENTAQQITVDASALTANTVLDLSGNTGAGVSVTGSATAKNTITGTGNVDVLVGGAGVDSITGGVGADVMTGGASTDTFVIANTATGTPTSSNFDTITDYAGDKIDYTTDILQIGTHASTGAGDATISSTGIATFNAADDTLAEQLVAVASAITLETTAAGESAVWVNGSDSYLFISDGTDGVSATDVLIKLTGVSSLSTGITLDTGVDITNIS